MQHAVSCVLTLEQPDRLQQNNRYRNRRDKAQQKDPPQIEDWSQVAGRDFRLPFLMRQRPPDKYGNQEPTNGQ